MLYKILVVVDMHCNQNFLFKLPSKLQVTLFWITGLTIQKTSICTEFYYSFTYLRENDMKHGPQIKIQ